jgi:hypothetical protein
LLAVCLLLLSASCSEGTAEVTVVAEDLPRIAERTATAARRFTWTLAVAGRKVEMKGVVEDDYRYQADVSVDGRPTYSEVVYDDARYLSVSDSSAIAPGDLAAIHEGLAAMTTGWVVDPMGAPPEFAGGGNQQPIPLASSFVLERVRHPEGLPPVLMAGFKEWNILAADYLPKNDKFPEHPDDGTKFDSFPMAYDPNAVTVTFPQLRPFFEYVSVWAKPTHIDRVERLIELPDPREDLYKELYTQLGRAGSRALVTIIRSPGGRRFVETYRFEPAPDAAVTPPESAQTLELAPALGALRTSLAALGPEGSWTPLVGIPQ